jgi:PAS domain S-box-containing protein
LQVKEARLRTIFETSYQYQGLLALDGTLLDANATSLASITSKLADLIGVPFWETPWFTGTPGMAEMVRTSVSAAAAGEAIRHEISINLPIGRRSFDFTVRPVRDADGAVVAVMPEAVDITERRQAEEQLRQSQKMEAMGQLTGGIAHDFNNLLTGISGSFELLKMRLAQGRLSDVERYITAGQGAASRAAALTHRLLAFARRQTLDPKPIQTNRLVTDMMELIRHTAGPAIEVETVLAAGLWPTLCDPNQLENALLNLCINARDAMPDGGRLTIETANIWLDERDARERDMVPGQYVAICVTDTGSGMPPEVVARAFDPFFTTKPLGMGTGLGLSMIYGFTRQSGGQVCIDSEVGQGTTMRIYLPRHRGGTEGEQTSVQHTEVPRAETGETVLVVDDEPTVRMLVTDVLKDLGYAAIEAVDGASGLRVLHRTGASTC